MKIRETNLAFQGFKKGQTRVTGDLIVEAALWDG
jgi:hypothetical protein